MIELRWARWFTIGNRNTLGYATKALPTLWHLSSDGETTLCGKPISDAADRELPSVSPIMSDPVKALDLALDPPDHQVRQCSRCAHIFNACLRGEIAKVRNDPR